jgi:sec-independent protein translocase protein TatC
LISAAVTLPEVFSQLILAVRLVVQYGAGIIAARLIVDKPLVTTDVRAARPAERIGVRSAG